MVNRFEIRQNQVTEDGKYIGYFSDKSILPFKRGDIVTIPKGTRYHSMKDGEYHIAGRTYKVKVDHILCGTDYMDHGKRITVNPEISWAGSGGYWHRCDINDVKKG